MKFQRYILFGIAGLAVAIIAFILSRDEHTERTVNAIGTAASIVGLAIIASHWRRITDIPVIGQV